MSCGRAARPYAAWMLAGVAAITVLRLVWLALQPADLFPDEAQYWVWSQELALGYYSKPPLVAWLIAATTGLFGDSEFAVRLSAPLLHAGAAAFVYGIGARLYDARVGFWSALTYASLPGVSVSAFVISTDAPLLLFWAAALYSFVRARDEDGWAWWLTVGLAAGLGLLAKYAMAYWLLSALGFVLLFPGERRHLRPLLSATGIALVLYSPNFWWNWRNGFVSYLHTRDNAALSGQLFHPGAFIEFVGAQFGVFGPLLFAGLILLTATWRGLAEPRARLLAAFALPTLTMMMIVSLLSRAHANWAAPTYVAATVLVVAWALQCGWRRLLIVSIALHLAAVALLFTGREALAACGLQLPAQYDPLRRVRGWRELGTIVGKELAARPGLTLFADDRELTAALIFYIRPHPLDAVKWKVTSRIQDQWDLANALGKRLGNSFLLVSEHELINEMEPSFATIERLRSIAIPLGPGTSRTYTLYIARDFKGYPPGRT
ncbi:MAG: glycosyltransferase family 39 protein [Alphaproteobacteria bacterium]|nr:glycosyltransferase family 39 protein [Alphaproteobacteria bacterium]MBV9375460.1 glycosyltransferase family 39 protein [Alphaproteobacteria bacterium]